MMLRYSMKMGRHVPDMALARILYINTEIFDTIRYDTLPISKYPCIIPHSVVRFHHNFIQFFNLQTNLNGFNLLCVYKSCFRASEAWPN